MVARYTSQHYAYDAGGTDVAGAGAETEAGGENNGCDSPMEEHRPLVVVMDHRHQNRVVEAANGSFVLVYEEGVPVATVAKEAQTVTTS